MDFFFKDLVWLGVYSLGTSGFCMWPVLWPGGSIRVQRCALGDLRPGDIAVYFDGRRFVSHRVVRVEGDRLVTRGDRNAGEDPPVAKEQVLGRVTRFEVEIPGLGRSFGWGVDDPVVRAAVHAVARVPLAASVILRLYGVMRRTVGRCLGG